MKKTTSSLLSVLGASMIAWPLAPVNAAEAILTDDAEISNRNAEKNFGSRIAASVNHKERTLLRFDLSNLPAGVTAEQVSKATLLLWARRVRKEGILQLEPLQSTWDELSVTRANAPSLGEVVGEIAISSGNNR